MDVVVPPVHSAGSQSQFDDHDHGSSLDDTKSLWAEPPIPTPAPATLIESSSSRPMWGELLEGCSDEAVWDVRAPVIIDASPCRASSTGTSSHDLANELPLLHVQENSGSHEQQSGPTSQSSGYGTQSHNVNTSRQQLHPRQYSHRGRRGNGHWNVGHTNNNMRGVPRPLPTPLHPFSPHLPPFSTPQFAPSPRPVPLYMPHVQPPHWAILEFELRLKIVKQVEYYFSYSNLITDEYLRRRMDEQGWVPVRIIAGFRKIKELTDNIQIILDALRTSAVLEILGDKVRSRFNWQGWSIPIDAPSYTVFSEPMQN